MRVFNLFKRRPENHLTKCLVKLSRRLSPGQFSDVIAAWRGPDLQDSVVKLRTTAIIRRAILNEVPGWFGVSFGGLVVARKVRPIYLPDSAWNSSDQAPHFCSHISYAARALGIKVVFKEEEKNDD